MPAALPARPITTLGDVVLTDVTGEPTTAAAVFAQTYTDAWLVLSHGALVAEWYNDTGGPDRHHALMSVTKSIVGAVAGILIDRGLLDPGLPASHYVPELAAGGHGQARVRDLLDMRTGAAFREEYTDPSSQIRLMADWLGWQGPITADRGLYSYLTELGTSGPHGGGFVYRSADTDVLGWVCERVAGQSMAQLMGDLVWRPMGAGHSALLLSDALGTALHDGGLAVTARDLARFGDLIVTGGRRRDTGEQVIPPQWVREVTTVDVEVRTAFAQSPSEAAMPGGWYRDQFWVRPDSAGTDIVLGIGIFGQMLFVNRATETVGVKFSSWPVAQSPQYLEQTFRAFDAVAQTLGGVTSRRRPTSPPEPGAPLL